MAGSLSHRRPLALLARQALTVAAVGLSVGLSGSLTSMGAGVASAATGGQAFLRTAHLSPDTPGVDVYVTATPTRTTVIRNETYGHFSPYLALPAGSYSVATRLAGSSATGGAIVSWKMTLKPGDAYTAAVIGTGGERRGTVLHDDLTPPAQGKARVRLIQAASNAPVADVTANGNVPVANGAKFASVTGYVSLPAGTWPLAAKSTEGKSVHVAASISLASGSITSIVLLDKAGGGLALTSALDSAAAGQVPVKGINTGGGGLARSARTTHLPGFAVGVTAASLVAGATLLVGRRRRATCP